MVRFSEREAERREFPFLLFDVQFQAVCFALKSPAAIIALGEFGGKIVLILAKSSREVGRL